MAALLCCSVNGVAITQEPGTEGSLSADSHTLAAVQQDSVVRIQRLSANEPSSERNDLEHNGIEGADSELDLINTDSLVSTGYVDKLIAPSQLKLLSPTSSNYRGEEGRLYQSIYTAAYYRENLEQNLDSLDTGIEYLAYYPSNNYGDFRLNLIALNEDDQDIFSQNGDLDEEFSTFESQQGLQRYSIEQIGLPLNSELNMDNIIGTHGQANNLPFRNRVSVVNQRFGGSEPDILGVTSRIYNERTGVAVSAGKLGDTYGAVLPGFVETDGRVARLMGMHIDDYFTISADLWQTSDYDDGNLNRVGSRFNWQAIWQNDLESTATLASSDDSLAVLLGLADRRRDFEQDGGLYYFQDDFVWIDTKLGDDFLGGYYRFSHNYRTLYYGATLEHRRDGIDSNRRRELDTTYASLNSTYRLDRSSSVSGTYTYRRIDDRSGQPTDISATEHSLRGIYALQHNQNTRSNFGALVREGERSSSQRIYYDLFQELTADSSAELGLEYNREDNDSANSDRYRVELSYQRFFFHGGSLAVGAGYDYSDDPLGENTGWNGFLNYDLLLGRHWTLSAQLDYNYSEYDPQDVLLFDDILGEDSLQDFDLLQSEQVSALFSVRYTIGEQSASNIIAANGLTRGSGRLRGKLYTDTNGDGVAQINEEGLAGVTVYLNSIYPVTTNAHGEFEFDAVAPGNHHLFIDERSLPLPWTLEGAEYTPVEIRLRGTAEVNIAAGKL